MPKSPDDLESLKAERAAADREYNDALTRLDAAIQTLPASFPHSLPRPDAHQVAPLNTLWKISAPPADPGVVGRMTAAVRRMVAPLFEQQQAFNAAVVDHINRNLTEQQAAGQAIDHTSTLLRDQFAEMARFQSLLIIFLQQITPYVDTRDRDVAGLLRGLSSAINAVSDELMKRSEAMLSRDRRRETQLGGLEAELADMRARLDTLQRALAGPLPPAEGGSAAT